MSEWTYKIFARRLVDRDYFLVEIELWANQAAQVRALQREFGDAWQVWIEKFPTEHPHAALQRRLHTHHTFKAKSLRGAGENATLESIRIQHHERDAINELIARPQFREPVAKAPTDPEQEPAPIANEV